VIPDRGTVLLDVIDPDKRQKLDEAVEPGDIWHDDHDDGGAAVLDTGKGMRRYSNKIYVAAQ